jgi:F-type H+-transporting ATPase subunit delta
VQYSNALAVRYAQALFGLAKKTNKLDEQLGELVKVGAIFSQHPALGRSLQSPTIPSTVKKSILQKVLAGRVSDTTLHFFYVLVDKNREVYLESIIEGYKELLRHERGQVHVVIQSAGPLSPAVQQQVQTRMREYTGKTVELTYEVDPELLGGLVIRVGDRIIDGSVRHQLSQIHERLTRAGAAAVGG